MTHFPMLTKPIDLGCFVLPNRVIMGSMHTGLEDLPDGMERLAVFYQERVKGGVGLIVTGGFSPNKEGRLFPQHTAMLETQEAAEQHKIVTQHVHEVGGKILLQILHTGRYGYHNDIVAPSPIKAPINSRVPRELSDADILRTIDEYVKTAELAKFAGYDGVEIMGSEGYLINQFLVQHTNKREDKWGGEFLNRIRFPLEIIKQIREYVGNKFCIMYRLSMLDLIENGSTREENLILAKAVEQVGANIINTGIGWHEAKIPTISQAVPRGGFAWVTARLMNKLSIPLITTNRINTPEAAEKILADRQADLVSMARPFLADPNFVNKIISGDSNSINNCIACNQACLDFIFEGKSATCMVNPRAGHETKLNWIVSPFKKKVGVIGCGPAGMAAASIAAERGHDVTAFDSADRIGGQFNLAKNVPGKEEFAETLRYFAHQFKKFGVKLKLNTVADEKIIQNESFDELIIATGCTPRKPDIKGINNSMVIEYSDVLSNKREVGERVIILGGGGIAFDTALYIIEKNSQSHIDEHEFKKYWGIEGRFSQPKVFHQITMLQRSPSKMGRSLGKTTGWVHKAILKHNLVQQICGIQYLKVSEQGILISNKGRLETLDADSIIICAGQLSNDQLAKNLNKSGTNFQTIGGAKTAKRIDARRAFDEGTRAAANL